MALRNSDCPSTKAAITSGTLQALATQHKKQTSALIYATVMPFQLTELPPTVGIFRIYNNFGGSDGY